MTFEKVLAIFAEHLKNDDNVEVVKVKKGYLHLYWDKVRQDYDALLLTTLEELFKVLLDDVAGYYKFESEITFSSDEERESFVRNLQEKLCEQLKD